MSTNKFKRASGDSWDPRETTRENNREATREYSESIPREIRRESSRESKELRASTPHAPTSRPTTPTKKKRDNRADIFIESLTELSVHLGILKSKNFSLENSELSVTASSKLSFYAKLTRVQEILWDIENSITSHRTTVKGKFSSRDAVKALDEDQKELEVDLTPYRTGTILTGASLTEAEIHLCRVIIQRCLRHLRNLCALPDHGEIEGYLLKLSDFLLALAVKLLHIETKQTPLKYM